MPRGLCATIVAALATLLLTSTARSQTVSVTVSGEVEFNQITSGPFAAVAPGDTASFSFELDPAVFTDSASFPVRGYHVDVSSFTLNLGGVSVGLAPPAPAVQPYFSIRNDDPAVDGFLLTDVVDFPNGVATDVMGSVGPFKNNFYVTYGGGTLSSLDLLNAIGTYDFTGLTVFNWTITDGPFDAMGMIFASLEITAGTPAPSFRRGDANDDGSVDVSDAVFTLDSLFVSGTPAACDDAVDSNDDGTIDISDAVTLLGALFVAGSPPIPAPGTVDCGPDPTADSIDCAASSACP